ncbi:hypothetical protein [Dokdonella fugitiva]|uniref:hypothetical protein n=1 Tax=Dokdonella fugitiva TaxID=328517 RepID=UPI0015FA376D|nr:hypothetical protein [Dokdonella fugitiva]MBA8883093.1 Zn finger protein HypA/HybF involved in hydrogenase expression [Dokdonella fugitiva]
MGKHTAYWENYSRAQVRGALRMSGVILAWVFVLALLAAGHDAFGKAFPWLIGAGLVGLAATTAWLAMRAQKVVCPECATTYTRHKWGGCCPHCGLGLLQQDP